jgi:hypothetical protein
MLGKNVVDYDNGIAIGLKRFLRNLHDTVLQQADFSLIQEPPRRNHRSTQELAVVSKK